MTDLSAQIDNIPYAPGARKTALFTSAVSATAIISLFVVLMVQMLGRI